MKTRSFLILIVVSFSLALWAADSVARLNVKEGLWEVTSTHSMTGMPAMPSIPPETLAKMPAEQRAKVEAMMKGGMGAPKTDIRRECITKEKLDKQMVFAQNRGECTHTIVSSTGSRLEMKIHCASQGKDQQMSTDGTFLVEVTSSDSARGSMHTVTTGNSQNMNMDFTFSSKYLGPACGDVK
jgi:Protein of unknown function (DUF3617)